MHPPFLDHLFADGSPAADAAVQRLAESACTVHVNRNDHVYGQGTPNEGIHLVAHGAIVLEWSRPSGSALGFRLALAGDHFGARSFCAGQAHAASARAVREAMVMLLPRDELTRALAEVPGLWRILAREVARDSGPQLVKVMHDPRIAARKRLAHLLAHLDERLADRVTPVVGHPDSPLRQRDLAHLLDVTDETISRSLSALVEAGLLQPDRDGTRIPDPAALDAFAESER